MTHLVGEIHTFDDPKEPRKTTKQPVSKRYPHDPTEIMCRLCGLGLRESQVNIHTFWVSYDGNPSCQWPLSFKDHVPSQDFSLEEAINVLITRHDSLSEVVSDVSEDVERTMFAGMFDIKLDKATEALCKARDAVDRGFDGEATWISEYEENIRTHARFLRQVNAIIRGTNQAKKRMTKGNTNG